MATSEAPELIGLAQRTLRDLRLRVAGASGGGPDALREAGYAGATSLFDAFETWLNDSGSNRAEDLPIDQFSSRAAEFFQHAGWGRVSFRSLHDALAVIDIEDCWESQLHGQGETGCHLTTGTLAGFLGCLADYPVAVMEIECGTSTNSRCRFLAGNADMLEHAYERLSRGEEWETIGAGEF
ncbi:MAG TPA: 4-vinyl reductase [Gemmatimonadaceae bacterium]|jgi:predicted hydrocarbon binding protein|nr:4-vinyl reductase [Gemmatimonadaceae bacterium]